MTKTQFILGDFFCTNLRLRQCLYWEIAPALGTQVYGHLAHQLGRDDLVHAAVSAEFLHPDEDPPDTRGPRHASADLARNDQTSSDGRAWLARRGISKPRLAMDCTGNVVIQHYSTPIGVTEY